MPASAGVLLCRSEFHATSMSIYENCNHEHFQVRSLELVVQLCFSSFHISLHNAKDIKQDIYISARGRKHGMPVRQRLHRLLPHQASAQNSKDRLSAYTRYVHADH